MKLTGALLQGELARHFSVTGSRLGGACPPVGRPLLYAPGDPVEGGRLYLTEAAAPALCRGDAISVYTGGSFPTAEDGAYLCLDTDSWQALNVLQRLFDRYDSWERELEQILLEGGSVQRLLEVSQAIFGNPLVVVGTDFRVAARSDGETPGADPFSGGGAVELANALRQDELYNQMLLSREPVLFPAHILGSPTWNVNLLREGQVTHRLVLLERERPLGAADGYLLDVLAPYVTYLLERERVASPFANGLHELFQRILSDRTADYVEMSERLSAMGWDAGDEYFCVVFQLTYVNQKDRADNLICDYLEKKYGNCCSFQYKEDVVAFFDVSRGKKTLREISNEMKYFIRESYLKAGYSRLMVGHSNLRRQYVQACIALDVGGRVKPYLWIHYFNSIAFRYLLEQSTRRLPGYMLCHEKLLVLQEHDTHQHTAYMKTLRVYLDQNLNAVQTAKELFIHRSTFLYRLERIKALLESDLSDPEELLYLSLSFRLLENERKSEGG